MDKAQHEKLGPRINTKKEILINWQPPPRYWTELDSDRATCGCLGKDGCGGVIWDWDGNLLRAFAKNLGMTTAI